MIKLTGIQLLVMNVEVTTGDINAVLSFVLVEVDGVELLNDKLTICKVIV